MSRDGQLLVVWEDHHEVFARHRGARGTWGSVHPLGPGVQCNLQAAMDATGRMLVAWESQCVDEGEASRPATVSFIAAAPGHGFGTLRKIENSAFPATDAQSPRPACAWRSPARTRRCWHRPASTARTASCAPRRSPPATSARASSSAPGIDAVLGDAAAAPDGQALVLWLSNVLGTDPVPGLQPQLLGNVRQAGAPTFGGPEAIGGATRPVFSPPHCGDRPGHWRLDRALRRFRDGTGDGVRRPPTAP